jgi:prolyl-tRNA synthetase
LPHPSRHEPAWPGASQVRGIFPYAKRADPVTRLSTYFLPTEKEPPADAEAISHVLMVRAGLVRQLGAGMWSFLPAGWRAHRRAEQVIREEMDRIGAQEMLMPVLQPAELWRTTGRYEIPELFKLEDRNARPLVLAMTHEESVTYHVSRAIRSYRDLPKLLYHFQIKERDEPRPRAGVLRTREFIMKDSYSFDRDLDGLSNSYELHAQAYEAILDRVGLRWYKVESDVGMMGGLGAHEYMAPCAAGENEVALADGGYAANVEVASAEPSMPSFPESASEPQEVETPKARTIEEVSSLLGVDPATLIKALPVVLEEGGTRLVLVRGDHRLNEIKLTNALGVASRPATEEEIRTQFGSEPGFIGPVGSKVEVLADSALETGVYVAGANRDGWHLSGVEPQRDFAARFVDVRSVEEGDRAPSGGTIRIEPAIEVGNIFKLGTRYSEPLGAKFLDESGTEQPIFMGSYGMGPARLLAAAIEQGADEQGISWPRALAPFDVHLVALGKAGSDEQRLADRLYEALGETGIDVLYDDRDASPGEKFVEAELLGCPLRVVAGRRSLTSGELEVQVRRGTEARSVPLDSDGAGEGTPDIGTAVNALVELLKGLP